MPSLAETLASQGTQANAALRAGLELISNDQQITFVKYTKVVIPVDGFLFWVQASLLGDTSPPLTIMGSLHTSVEKTQNDTESFGLNQIIFSAETDAQQAFNDLGDESIYIGSFQGISFAFSRLGYYEAAGIFHYTGSAIYPHMMSQIITNLTDFDQTSLVVSNSLPLWMSLNNYAPFYGFGNTIPLYPSFLTPPNLVPPYGAIHIPPENTEALTSTPRLTKNSSHFQLAKDKVKITFYGIRNDEAMNFLDCFLQYSQDYNLLGLMNNPIVRDDKLSQNELFMLAMRKSIEFEVSYHQQSVRDIARQLIEKAIPSFTERWPTRWN